MPNYSEISVFLIFFVISFWDLNPDNIFFGVIFRLYIFYLPMFCLCRVYTAAPSPCAGHIDWPPLGLRDAYATPMSAYAGPIFQQCLRKPTRACAPAKMPTRALLKHILNKLKLATKKRSSDPITVFFLCLFSSLNCIWFIGCVDTGPIVLQIDEIDCIEMLVLNIQ